ncbi:DUF1501 domain-containing protein [Frigidibacter oleivorans]|uniref:DUF1501 domain-containing protein n=1 Tax=Frigidibacter oleivorans TaxID=2487129 RepID=UPI000F8CEBEB|nr:DUF1501 domain-containing protein [Frigidibacter oleivorans]
MDPTTRRLFLKGATLIGCSAAAHPWLTTATFAGAPGDNRLVVIILRGAADGLDILQPWGDPDFAALRPGLALPPGSGPEAALDLDGRFAMHTGLTALMPMWQAGELAFVHATSTPYRDKRSHFDGQDLLEAGTGMDVAAEARRDGWLNRMLQAMPGVTSRTAFAVGSDDMRILAGPAPASSWAPAARLEISDQAVRLLDHVYHDDPAFREAVAQAVELSAANASESIGPNANAQPLRLAEFAAAQLRGETRIATFSIGGWDTHRNQANALKGGLARLAETLVTLRDHLGPVWGRTAVLAMTEFGRTARQNGTQGTDHGTGGAMLMAGGALKGGRVLGQWPGLAEADLYDRRDLMPTSDVRAWAGWTMRGMFGFDRALIEATLFPGLDMGSDPGLLL